jgi:hypothetical protein
MTADERLEDRVKNALDGFPFEYRGRRYGARVSRVAHPVASRVAHVTIAFDNRSASPVATTEIEIAHASDVKYLRRRALVALRRAVDGEMGIGIKR